MDKAARVVRRSSAKLLGGGHADLHLLLSEVKDMRNTAKSFMNAQNTVAQDLLKWAVHEENRALQDVANQLAELNLLWTEVQREFGEHVKDYRHMYEMVLEGEKHVAMSKNNFVACEQREIRVRKELKKAFKKASSSEIQMLEGRLSQAERAKDLAQMEVTDRIRENEAVKLIRLKEGLMKLSQAYSDFGRKCVVIFDTQQDIVQQLPDVLDQDLEDIKYTGSGVTRLKVQQAKEKVRNYRRASYPISAKYNEPPPPYSIQSDDSFGTSEEQSFIYPSVATSSPRRRVSDSFDFTSQSPSPASLPQPSSASTASVTSSLEACHSSVPGPHSIPTPASALSPPALSLSSTSPLTSSTSVKQVPPPPRPSSSPSQGLAGAAAAAPPTIPSSDSVTTATLQHTETPVKTLLYPQLHTSSLAAFPDSSPSPEISHSQLKHFRAGHLADDYPPDSYSGGDEELYFNQKQHEVRTSQTSPCQAVGPAPQSGDGLVQLQKGGSVQSLDIVDFNPDWDSNYEEGLNIAMGGAKI